MPTLTLDALRGCLAGKAIGRRIMFHSDASIEPLVSPTSRPISHGGSGFRQHSQNTHPNSNHRDIIPSPKECHSMAVGPAVDRHIYSKDIPCAWIVCKRIGPGLVNLGNTCFLNSVLQCLTYTPPLAESLLLGLHSPSCRIKSFCAMCAMEMHIKRCFKSGSSKPIQPRLFVENLRRISRSMRVGRQEDAHEFTRFLIEGLQKSEGSKKPEGTLTYEIFSGKLQSQIKCLKCKTTSDTFDPLLDISLDIKNCTSVEDALSRFTAPELLHKQNQCNTLRDAHKQITIHEPPTVLTVQLKRFGFGRNMGSKLSSTVSFKPVLHLDPFMSQSTKRNAPYNLFAVLVHSGGSCHSGHYHCFVKAPDRSWYSMNDTHVQRVEEKTVLSQSAYMLFYVRQTDSNPQQPKKNLAKSLSTIDARIPTHTSKSQSDSQAQIHDSLHSSLGDDSRDSQHQLCSKGISKADATAVIVNQPRLSSHGFLESAESVPAFQMATSSDNDSESSESASNRSISGKNATTSDPNTLQYNSTGLWNVSSSDGGHTQIFERCSKSISNTFAWNSSGSHPAVSDSKTAASSLSMNTPVWDNIDASLLYKRHELIEEERRLSKRKRPSVQDQEYDRPVSRKKPIRPIN
ncbi:hypothetical protein BSLG_008949 [Batrachochytrium salamandrivorans]|nr:hypothetical protein BSLG_008949 [Batrachochytrium salamandrivorans]